MKKIKLNILLPVILLSTCVSADVKQGQTKTTIFNDVQLKTLLIGKSMFGKYKGKTWTSTVNPDGTIDNYYDGRLRKKGTYTIRNNMYCRTWNKSGKRSCWTMHKRTNDYYGNTVSGSSSSFKFRVK